MAAKPVREVGEAPDELFQGSRLAVLLAQDHLGQHQLEGQFVAGQLREALQVGLDRGALPAAPALHHVAAEPVSQSHPPTMSPHTQPPSPAGSPDPGASLPSATNRWRVSDSLMASSAVSR